MKVWTKVSVFVSLGLCAALALAVPAFAQTTTTGSIAGTVVDQQGGVLPGATVVATHVPTGTTYEGVVKSDGRFELLNLRVGPYSVTVTMTGFKPQTLKDINVNLGEQANVSAKLELQSVSTSVEVTAKSQGIDFSQAGSASNISHAQQETVPTIARSIIDIVQVNPYFSGYITNGNGQTSFAVAGRNNRYNNISIDGAVNNDIFGLSATGTPEGQSSSQPISLDAIQEFQLVVSPYDVRQGGFSGGAVNIVTKGGSNELHGDGFYYGRNQSWVGKYYNPNLLVNGALAPGDVGPIATFSDKQGGGSVGGPIQKNKLFFFASSDSQRQLTPSGVCADCNNGTFNGSPASVDAIVAALKNTYGYNPAGSSGLDPEGDFIRATNSDKIFGRVDYNVAKGQQLTIRHNYVNSLADVGTPSSTLFLLPDDYYRIAIKTHSTVGQLNSTIGKSSVNELRVTGTTIRNHREPQPFVTQAFPFTSISIGSGVTVRTGIENSSPKNQLDQNDVEINDDFTTVHGSHTLTVGTHDEFFSFRNLFIQNAFGNYSFTNSSGNGLANFQAGLAQGYQYFYSGTGDPNQAAKFAVRQWGAYAGDQWRPASNVTFTYGIRVDAPRFNSVPTANPLTVADFNLRTDITPSPTQWSPRFGFGWDPFGNGKQQFRAGVGIFAGRTPYVWLSNQFATDGVDFKQTVINSNSNLQIVYVTDPNNQPITPTCLGSTSCTAATTKTNIDLIDPNYKFPKMLRGNIAYDANLPWGMIGTAEFTWQKTMDDILFQNLNIGETGATNKVDGRPVFKTGFVDPNLGAVIYLTNSTVGHGWTQMFEVRRPFTNGFMFDFSYLYGQAFSQQDGGSSVATTNFNDVYALNPNSPALTVSDYDPGNRVTLNASYRVPFFKDYSVTASVFYSGQSGHPYTLSFAADANGDGVGFNDNMYLATGSESSLAFTSASANGAASDLLNKLYLPLGQCAVEQTGQIFVRNSCRAPWLNTLNARINVGLPFKKVKAEITLDILNLLNLLDDHNGIFKFANFNQIDVVSVTPTTGQYTSASLSTINRVGFSPWSIDDVRSRWQMQLGGRISF